MVFAPARSGQRAVGGGISHLQDAAQSAHDEPGADESLLVDFAL